MVKSKILVGSILVASNVFHGVLNNLTYIPDSNRVSQAYQGTIMAVEDGFLFFFSDTIYKGFRFFSQIPGEHNYMRALCEIFASF